MCLRFRQKRALDDAPASGELQPGSTAGLEASGTVRDSDSNVSDMPSLDVPSHEQQQRISDMPSLDENRIRQIVRDEFLNITSTPLCSEFMISVFNQWLKDERFVVTGMD